MSDQERADAAAWLAVAAGTIGALMATLDTSIVNASLPTIQGEIGASTAEGTWISTAYLVAEIIMIPLAAWFEEIFGLKRLLLIATTLFILFSMLSGVADNLIQMIVGRVGQGFTGGAMIPTALTIVATRLPPGQQPVGIALFGMTAIMGPVIGPIVGGWLTENFSWHYAFFINLPIGFGLLCLVLVGLPAREPKWSVFRDTDLLGLVGLVLGLGGLTIVLEEGQRERWFESTMILELSCVALIGFAALVAGQFIARKPVIQLQILLQRSFAGVFVMSLMAGGALFGVLYIIPQFLSAVPGYDSEQSGLIAAISGVPPIVMMVFFPFLVRRVDVRAAIAFGLLLYGIGCFMSTGLNSETSGPQFVVSQIVRGFGQFFSLMFLNQAATRSVTREFTEDASGLFNVARNLGGSFALAAIATLQDRRQTLHAARLSEALTANSLAGQAAARTHGVAWLNDAIQAQAVVMTYADLYWVFGVTLLLMIPLVLLLKPTPSDTEGAVGA